MSRPAFDPWAESSARLAEFARTRERLTDEHAREISHAIAWAFTIGTAFGACVAGFFLS